MFDVLSDINWIAILLATFASAAFGALWFLVVIPKQYALALGREGAPQEKPSSLASIGPVFCTLVTTVTSAVLIEALEINDIATALAFGAIVGVGYLCAMTFNIAINPNFPRPLFYGVINAPFFVIGSLMTSAILVTL